MRFPLAASIAGLMLSTSSLAESPTERGQVVFKQYCASCHGAGGKGDGLLSEAMRVKPADLTRISERRNGQFPRSEITAYIDGRRSVTSHGSRDMPVWGERFAEAAAGTGQDKETVNSVKLRQLVQYLESIQVAPTVAPAPAPAPAPAK